VEFIPILFVRAGGHLFAWNRGRIALDLEQGVSLLEWLWNQSRASELIRTKGVVAGLTLGEHGDERAC